MVLSKWLQSSIWHKDGTLTGITTFSQSGLGSNDNERELHIPQRSRTGVPPLDGLSSYLEHVGTEQNKIRCIIYKCIANSILWKWIERFRLFGLMAYQLLMEVPVV